MFSMQEDDNRSMFSFVQASGADILFLGLRNNLSWRKRKRNGEK
jgi:hypothetical protein